MSEIRDAARDVDEFVCGFLGECEGEDDAVIAVAYYEWRETILAALARLRASVKEEP